MSPKCTDMGSIQSSRTSADNRHVFFLLCGKQFHFSSHKRVHQTGNSLSFKHMRHTALQASDTRQKQIQFSVFCLLGKIRVCNALASKSNQIRSSFLHHQFCILRLCITSYRNHRNMDCLFDFRHAVCAEAFVKSAWRPHIFIVKMYGSGYMQGVHTTLFLQIRSHGCRVLRSLSSQNIIRGIDSADNCQRLSRFFSDIFNN